MRRNLHLSAMNGRTYPSLQSIRRHHCQKALLYLVIRKIQQKRAVLPIIILYRQIAALVYHRQRTLDIRLIVHKFPRSVVTACQLIHIFPHVGQQPHQIGRRSATEPIIPHHALPKSVQQAERVIDINHSRAKMVTVVLTLQQLNHRQRVATIRFGHFGYRSGEIMLQFVLRDAAERLILFVHADSAG